MATFKTFKTNTSIYFFSINEDGTLFITYNGKESIPNPGMFINNMGGIDAILARAEEKEYTSEEVEQYLKDRWESIKSARKYQQMAQIEREKQYGAIYAEKFNAMLAKYDGKAIESTMSNIFIILSNARYNGDNILPAMTIGYSLNLYDCGGKLAAAMKLDKPINVDGEMVDKFQVGAPHGHLMKYHRAYMED